MQTQLLYRQCTLQRRLAGSVECMQLLTAKETLSPDNRQHICKSASSEARNTSETEYAKASFFRGKQQALHVADVPQ
eukprot:1153667-Pelagomonas_calceolata.AAC.1